VKEKSNFISYINKTSIAVSDGPNADAFQRLRMSTPQTIFDSKQLYGDNPLIWSTLIAGNATSSFMTNNACMALSASATSSITRQSKKRINYQPGKSQLIICTGNFNTTPIAGVIKRIGYFDQNNGIGFTSSGSSFGTFLRSNMTGTPIDTFVSQSSWNLDHYDGTGASGNTLDITKSQIYFMDFEWLGVGRVRYGIFQGGVPTYVHQITNINTLSTVYMSSPNQPIRYEIINSGSVTQQYLTHVCSTVVSEGGVQQTGPIKATSNLTALALNAGNTYGLQAIRLKSGSLDSTVIPLQIFSAQTTANCVYEVSLLSNPSGSLPWVWNDVPNSTVQIASASANTYVVANQGTKLFSAINAGTTQNDIITFDPTFALGSDVTGSQDILVLAWTGVAGNAASATTAWTWQES